MDNSDFAKEIGLDPGFVQRDMEICISVAEHEGAINNTEVETNKSVSYGFAREEEAWLINRATVATCYRKAAAHALLLGQANQARNLFSQDRTSIPRLRSTLCSCYGSFVKGNHFELRHGFDTEGLA